MPSPTGASAITIIPRTGDPTLDAMLGTYRWSGPVITYSFPGAGSFWSTEEIGGYGVSSSGREPWSGYFDSLNASDKAAFKQAIGAWASVSNFTPIEVSESSNSVGDVRAAYSSPSSHEGHVGWTQSPMATARASDVWFNTNHVMFTGTWTPGSFQYYTLLHELGHALGLNHGWDTAGFVQSWNTTSLTVMSYSSGFQGWGGALDYYPTTPMVLDILAIQKIYGAVQRNTGDTTYSYESLKYYHETIWDTGGIDTLVSVRSGDIYTTVYVDLREGQGSYFSRPIYLDGSPEKVPNLWIAYGTVIENVVADDGNDIIVGNDANNTFYSGGGSDRLDGRGGFDVSVNAGNMADYYVYHDPDVAGKWIVYDHVHTREDTELNIERLVFDDYVVGTDIDGHAGQAYRLYQAAFGRTPDLPGLGYQINELDIGRTLSQIAGNFIASPEFQRTYGAVNNTQYITLLYQNVLHRAPDPGGLQYHLNDLAIGTTRAQILGNFSESPENKANVIGSIVDGVVYIPIS